MKNVKTWEKISKFVEKFQNLEKNIKESAITNNMNKKSVLGKISRGVTCYQETMTHSNFRYYYLSLRAGIQKKSNTNDD